MQCLPVREQMFGVLLDQSDGSDDIPVPQAEGVTKPYVGSRRTSTESNNHKPLYAQVNMHMRRWVFTRWTMQAHDEAIGPEQRRHGRITYLMGLLKR